MIGFQLVTVVSAGITVSGVGGTGELAGNVAMTAFALLLFRFPPEADLLKPPFFLFRFLGTWGVTPDGS